MKVGLIIQYHQERHLQMCAARDDAERQNKLRPLFQRDLRVLRLFDIPYEACVSVDYLRAQYRLSWNDLTCNSPEHHDLLSRIARAYRWIDENRIVYAQLMIKGLVVRQDDTRILPSRLLAMCPSVETPADKPAIEPQVMSNYGTTRPPTLPSPSSPPDSTDSRMSSPFSLHGDLCEAAVTDELEDLAGGQSSEPSVLFDHPPTDADPLETRSRASTMLPTPEASPNASPMLENAEAPWMAGPAQTAGKKRSRPEDLFSPDLPPNPVAPSSGVPVPMAPPSAMSAPAQEPATKRARITSAPSRFPRFQKKSNLVSANADKSQTQPHAVPSTTCAPVTALRNATNTPATVPEVQDTPPIILQKQLKDAQCKIQELEDAHKFEQDSWNTCRLHMQKEIEGLRIKFAQANREKDEALKEQKSVRHERYWKDCGHDIAHVNCLRTENHKLKVEVKRLENDLLKAKDELCEGTRDMEVLYDKCESEKTKLRAEIKSLESQRAELAFQFNDVSTKYERSENRVHELESELEKRVDSLEDMTRRAEEAQKIVEERDELHRQNRLLTSEKEHLEERTKSLEADKQSLQQRIDTLTTEIKGLKSDRERLEREKTKLAARNKSLAGQKTRADGSVKALRDDRKALEDIIEALQAEKKHSQDRADEALSQKKTFQEQASQLIKETSGLTARLNALKAEKAKLETRIKNLEAENKRLLDTHEVDQRHVQELNARLSKVEISPIAVLECAECATKAALAARLESMLEKQAISSRETIDGLKQNLEDARNERWEAEVKVKDLTEKVSEFEKEIQRLKDENVVHFQQEVRSLVEELPHASAESQRAHSVPSQGEESHVQLGNLVVALRRDLLHERDLRQAAERRLVDQQRNSDDLREAWQQCKDLLASERKEHESKLEFYRMTIAQDNVNLATVRRECDERVERMQREAERKQKLVELKEAQLAKVDAAYKRQLEDSQVQSQRIQALTHDLTSLRGEYDELKAAHDAAVQARLEVEAKLGVERKTCEEYKTALKGFPPETTAAFFDKIAKIAEKAGRVPDP